MVAKREKGGEGRNSNDIGERNAVPSEGTRCMVTYGKNTYKEIEATNNGIVWFPELRRRC